MGVRFLWHGPHAYRAPEVRVRSRQRQDIKTIFDRSGFHERVPSHEGPIVREARRMHHDVNAMVTREAAPHFWKPHVVANQHAYLKYIVRIITKRTNWMI